MVFFMNENEDIEPQEHGAGDLEEGEEVIKVRDAEEVRIAEEIRIAEEKKEQEGAEQKAAAKTIEHDEAAAKQESQPGPTNLNEAVAAVAGKDSGVRDDLNDIINTLAGGKLEVSAEAGQNQVHSAGLKGKVSPAAGPQKGLNSEGSEPEPEGRG
jgi:hypothetical protein